MTISEASAHSGVQAHVLRYWESEFEALAPGKNAQGHRNYVAPDLDVIERIRYLLREEKYTIEGARQRIALEATGAAAALPREDFAALRAFLVRLRDGIQPA